jgi:hypothetical protein
VGAQSDSKSNVLKVTCVSDRKLSSPYSPSVEVLEQQQNVHALRQLGGQRPSTQAEPGLCVHNINAYARSNVYRMPMSAEHSKSAFFSRSHRAQLLDHAIIWLLPARGVDPRSTPHPTPLLALPPAAGASCTVQNSVENLKGLLVFSCDTTLDDKSLRQCQAAGYSIGERMECCTNIHRGPGFS